MNSGAGAADGGEWPLSGRSAELAHLQALLKSGRAGAVLSGRAGAGKTRLGAEFLTVASAAGLGVIRVRGTRATSAVPFGALATELPSVAGPGEGGRGGGTDLIRRYAVALVKRAGGNRFVLFVDDAHLLDGGSAALIHQLVAGNRAFVLVALLAGEAPPDPVTALWQDGLVERREVAPLGADVLEPMLAEALGAPLDPAALDELVEIAGGNLQFLRALVQGGLREGSLQNEAGIWRAPGGIPPPSELVELVEHELAALDTDERAALELVAFGEPLGSAEIDELTSVALIERLERLDLVESRLDRRRLAVRTARRVHRDVLRFRLPVVRRQALAKSLVALVERHGRRAGDTMRTAVWRLDGDWASPEVMLMAASTARWQYDFPLAERLARAAVEAGGGFEAELLAAQMAEVQGRSAEAEEQFRHLAGTARTDTERALVAIAHSNHLCYEVGRIEDGLELADEAKAGITDLRWRDEITARSAGVLLATDGPAAAVAAIEPLLGRAEGRALVVACFFATIGLGRVGRLDDALEASTRGYAAHAAWTGRPLELYPSIHLFHHCDTLAYAGRLGHAEDLAMQEYQAALADHSRERQAMFAWAQGKLAVERGHVRAAERLMREAVALNRELGRPQLVRGCLIHLGLTLALAGRTVQAKEVLTGPEAPDFSTPLYTTRIDLLIAWAWLTAGESDLPRARRFLTNAAAQAAKIGDAVGEAASLHALARLGKAKDVLHRLEELADVIEGPFVQTRVAHARCLVNDDPEGLEQTSAAFAALGVDLVAAEAAADAAVVWRRQGDQRQAAAAQRMSGLLAARCNGASTPALTALESRVHLTPAERDAAQLAAVGHSNREIAEALHLSVRTIENQLQRVYNKLGVSSRAELPGALGGQS